MQRFRASIEEFADRDVTFRDPRSVVEQARSLEERRKVDLDKLAAEPLDPPQHRAEQPLALRIAEIFELTGARRAKSRAFDIARARAASHRALAARKGIGRVEALRDGEHVARIVGGEREDRYAIERPTGRHDAARAEQAAGRLETDEIVESRRHAARSRGVGAERKTDEAGGDRDRRAGARSAGNAFRRQRARRRAIRRARAVETGGELIEIGLADCDGARIDQTLNDMRRLPPDIREFRARGGRRRAREVDVVLDRKGHAIQRLAGETLRFEAARGRQQIIARPPIDPDVIVAARFDARDDIVDEARRRQRPVLITPRQSREVEAARRSPTVRCPRDSLDSSFMANSAPP